MFTSIRLSQIFVLDQDAALEFYVGFLGFEEKWRHQCEPDLPVYMGVERDGVLLHLSEHFGDATPGAHVRIDSRSAAARPLCRPACYPQRTRREPTRHGQPPSNTAERA